MLFLGLGGLHLLRAVKISTVPTKFLFCGYICYCNGKEPSRNWARPGNASYKICVGCPDNDCTAVKVWLEGRLCRPGLELQSCRRDLLNASVQVSAAVSGTQIRKLLLLGAEIFVNSLANPCWLCLCLLPFPVSPQGPSALGTELLEAFGEERDSLLSEGRDWL